MRTFPVAFLIVLLSLPALGQYLPQRIIGHGSEKYLSNEIVIKLRMTVSSDAAGKVSLPPEIHRLLGEAKITDPRRIFTSPGLNSTGLSRIINVNYIENVDPVLLASKLRGSRLIEWAEPRYVYETSYAPNDPSLNSQWALTKVNAAAAWDISQGDTNVVIGIVDTGVDWDHPDLNANVKRNWNEIPDNNIDDDNNGYIDDVLGWDFGGLTGTPDNNPTEDQPDHGTHVAGIASAVTNNAVGVAALGFKCKLLAVKTCQNNYRSPSNQPYVIFGYEGIIYAAQRGAKVINCSWGGGGYSIFGQEVIDAATAMGALVVAAAGNSNSSDLFYPASYDKVLSVASTGSTDQRSTFSNYGTATDVAAPGEGIINTWMDNTYTYLSGTSMASPHAAGLAALVRSQFPALSPVQAAERIRTTADNINAANPLYADLLGKGRINAAAALTGGAVYSVRGYNFVLSDAEGGDGDGIIENGETISVRASFKNYLSPVSSLTITLESTNGYAVVTVPTVSVSSLGTLDSTSNVSVPFRFTVNTTATDAVMKFKFIFRSAGYTDFQWLYSIANPTYSTQSGNDVALTITSKGTLAFNDYPTNLQGRGFRYQESANFLFEGALMLATSASNVSDAARNSSGGSAQNADFTPVKPFVQQIPGSAADVEGSAIMNDNAAGTGKLGVTVKLNSYTYTSAPNDKFIILKYRIINNNTTALTNLYGGLFFDWDLVDGSGMDDFTQWDAAGGFGYTYHIGGSPDAWVASALVSDNRYGFWGILNGGGDGGFSIYDGFSDAEKYQALSSGIGKVSAGGGDISQVVSSGPYTLQPGDSVDIAFALAGGTSVTDLRSAVTAARAKYQYIITSVEREDIKFSGRTALYDNYPNPVMTNTVISYQVSGNGFVSLKVYDVLGREVAVLADGVQSAGEHKIELNTVGLSNGIYFYELVTPDYRNARKFILAR